MNLYISMYMCINTYMKISQSKKIKVSREKGPQILVYSNELKKANTKAYRCDISEY